MTFNVRTLNRIRKLPELTASAIDHNIDIICIQEHWYSHGDDIKYHDTGNVWTRAIASAWENFVNSTIGMLIGPRVLKLLNSEEKILLYFDPRPSPKILFQGDTPGGSDTFQWPVIKRDRVGWLRLMRWDKVKVPLCHYSDAPEESNHWTAWQLFPLDDD